MELMKEQEVKLNNTKGQNQVTLFTMLGNVLISTMFLLTGLLGKSIAAVSEGIDSLTDAVSSLLLLLGFKVSSMKPDELHPQGHKRFEYIIGLLLSELILFAAFSLGKESIVRILHPTQTPASILLFFAAGIGAIGKLFIYFYITKKNRVLKSTSLETYSKNTLADLKGIIFIMVSTVTQCFTSLPVDAAAGLIIAVLIFLDGLKSFMHNISLLIGENEEFYAKRGRTYAN